MKNYFIISKNQHAFRLSIADCLLIIDSFVQKSVLPYFAKESPLDPYWFKLTFPYFWYPFKGIIVAVNIYMMVAVSAERFRSVCYPLSKRYVSCYIKYVYFYSYFD